MSIGVLARQIVLRSRCCRALRNAGTVSATHAFQNAGTRVAFHVQIPSPAERLKCVRIMLARSDAWYVLRTAPLKEHLAEHVLRSQGFNAFAPVEMRSCRVSRRARRRVDRPFSILPRYIFVGFRHGERIPWHRIDRLKVTSGVLGYQQPIKDDATGKLVDMQPLCVSSEMVRALYDLSQISCEDGAKSTGTNPFRSLRAGDRGRFPDGPFAGCDFLLREINGNKAKAATTMFGSEYIVEIALENLDAA